MKRTRKLLCFLLALVFMAGLLPTAAPTRAQALTPGGCANAEDGRHNWQQYDFAAYPSCTENGTYIYICMNCWETEVGPAGEIPALGHDWGPWDNLPGSAPPSCTEGSQEGRFCSRCGEMQTRSVAALGHAWDGGTVTKEPSCTGDGSRSYKCTRCGESRTEAVAALGHAWDGGTVTKEPSCTEDGSAEYRCERCGQTEARAIPALGHDWGESETTEPEGIYDGKTVTVCRRCGETKDELIPVMPASFFASLRNLPLDGGGSDLRITQQPQGGGVDRAEDKNTGVELFVEAAGGLPPYRYEWHCESFEEADKSTSTVLNASAVLDLDEAYQGAAASWYAAHAATYESVFDSGWLSTVTEAAGGGSVGSLLGELNLFDKNLGSSGGPGYIARQGNCDYWVEVFDDAGDSVKSDKARVYYKVCIAQQPQNVNWQSAVDEELQAVFLECQAADGSGEYSYEWYWLDSPDGEEEVLYDIHERIGVTDKGRFFCLVTDTVTGDKAYSDTVDVYDAKPLILSACSAEEALWPEEEWDLHVTVEGGTPPYEVQWEKDGRPLETTEGDRDELGRPTYHAVGTDAGVYTVRVTDSMGETVAATTRRTDKKLTISQQPQDGTLPEDGSPMKMSIEVSDGTPPYTFLLYHDGRRQRTRSADVGSYVFDIFETGDYCISIRDADGHTARSNTVLVSHPKLRIASQTLAADYYGEAIFLSVVAEGGVEPYHYQWMVDTGRGWFTTGEDKSMLPVNTVGEYVCKITDDAEQVVRSERIPVEYKGEAPHIIEQPKSGVMDEDGIVDLWCEAYCGSGDENIRYVWQKNTASDGSGYWETRVYDRQGYLAHEPGLYRCRVTDTVTEKYVYSDIVAVAEKLTASIAEIPPRDQNHYNFTYAYLDIEGGLPPYSVTAVEVGQFGMPDKAEQPRISEGSPAEVLVHLMSEVIGTAPDGLHTTRQSYVSVYYFLISDYFGQQCKIEPTVIPSYITTSSGAKLWLRYQGASIKYN